MQKLSIAIGLLLAILFLTGSAIHCRDSERIVNSMKNIEQIK